MKLILNGIFGLSLFLLASCNKGEWVSGTIVRDCTGAYFRTGSQDLLICNEAKVSFVEDERTLELKFDRIEECRDERIRCMMARPFDGTIKVLKVRNP